MEISETKENFGKPNKIWVERNGFKFKKNERERDKTVLRIQFMLMRKMIRILNPGHEHFFQDVLIIKHIKIFHIYFLFFFRSLLYWNLMEVRDKKVINNLSLFF